MHKIARCTGGDGSSCKLSEEMGCLRIVLAYHQCIVTVCESTAGDKSSAIGKGGFRSRVVIDVRTVVVNAAKTHPC